MAQIKYLDSRRIMGESDGTDIAPTFEDKFSSDNWTDANGDTGVNTSTGRFEFDLARTTVNQSSYVDIGSTVSDTEWLLRIHDLKITTKSGGIEVFIGISSNTSGAIGTAQDFIGVAFGDNTANPLAYGVDADGSSITRLGGDYTYSLNTSYYVEVIRTSSTNYDIKIYSDSNFSTLLFSQSYTCTSTTTSLRYLKVANAMISGSTEDLVGSFDKITLFDGVTSVTIGKPKQALSLSGCKAYYNFEQTSGGGSVYDTQFNDSSGWTSSGSDVTISGGLAQYVISSGSSTSRIYRSQSITATFEANFDFIINSESRTDSSSQLLFTLSDSIYVGSGLGDTTGSYIGFGILYEASPARSTWIKSRYNNTDDASDSGTYNFSTSTQYFARVKRTSPTSVNYSVYGSDSDRTSETNSLTSRTMTISSNIPDLDYIIIGGRATGSGASDIDIDNIEVWNTTVNLTNIATTANGFDDGLGSSADGSNNGATTGATGKVGSYAWSFDGSNDTVQLGSSYSDLNFLHDGSSWSIAFWLKDDNSSQTSRIFSTMDDRSGSQRGISLVHDTTGFNLGVYTGTAGQYPFASTIASVFTDTNTWHHYVLTFTTGGSTVTLYKDGSSFGTWTKSGASFNTSDATKNPYIASRFGNDSFMGGDIDEFVIFNKTLTSSEVSTLYNGGTGVAVNDSSILSKPETNSIFIETDTAIRYLFNGTDWKYMEVPTYGLVAGGYRLGSFSNVIDYITITTTGNATDFGDLTQSRENLAGASSKTRGVIAGGWLNSTSNVMDYVTFGTPSNATDFGDLVEANYALGGNTSTETRGVFGGGFDNSNNISRLQYITIATTGNATNMGNLNQSRRVLRGVCSKTRGIYGGGYTTTQVNSMDYFTMETNANASDFGDLTVARYGTDGVMSFTRGVFGGGYTTSGSTYLNVIDYITMDTLGNASDFGDLTTTKGSFSSVTDRERGCWCGANGSSDVIEYITINTLGNATDFGDLTSGRQSATGVQGG